jgi:hypothetical protein
LSEIPVSEIIISFRLVVVRSSCSINLHLQMFNGGVRERECTDFNQKWKVSLRLTHPLFLVPFSDEEAKSNFDINRFLRYFFPFQSLYLHQKWNENLIKKSFYVLHVY